MIPDSLAPIANHLWQSTLFAGVAGLLTLALRKNSARVRHWIWVAASLKFLIPFSVLIAIGSHVEWRTAPAILPDVQAVVEQASQPFTIPSVSSPNLGTTPAAPGKLPEILLAIWACGLIGNSMSWRARWRRIAAAVHAGSPVELGLPIRAISSPTFFEPGVFGAFRPILLLPEGITERLTPEQWNSVLAHELCHVRHRDNLIAVEQMFVETAFWFHPLVWWIGQRICHERETACDEEVLRLGSEPGEYAQSILRVCELYLESPLECMPGVTGSDLKRRIHTIMTGRGPETMKMGRKLLLAAAAIAAVTVPTVIGVLAAPRILAQSPADTPKFEVASVRLSQPMGQDRVDVGLHMDGSQVRINSFPTRDYIARAFRLNVYQVVGPEWLTSERFDLNAKLPSGANADQIPEMLQSLLADRFQMKFHREKRELPVYALILGKQPLKIQESAPGAPGTEPKKSTTVAASGSAAGVAVDLGNGSYYSFMPDGKFEAKKISMDMLARQLERYTDRPIIDMTDLKGSYDMNFSVTEDDYQVMLIHAALNAGMILPPQVVQFMENGSIASLLDALQQLGLKMDARKAPLDVIVIDSISKTPTEN